MLLLSPEDEMESKNRRIGILGGTFNPIHTGHLIIAEAVRCRYGLEKIIFIPSGNPPHKPVSVVADGSQRYEMVRCAVSSNPYFEASRMEIDRQGMTYTVDTLKAIKELYGADTTIFFITGADVIPELPTWKSFQEVFGLCEFIAVLRPGHVKAAFDSEISRLSAWYNAVIHTVEAPLIDISSTDIRKKVAAGVSIKYMVPDCVMEYIQANGLYSD